MKHNSIAVFLSLILAGCSGVMTTPENGKGPQDGAGGNLTVRRGYSLSAGRTAYPSHNEDGSEALDYMLEFAWAGGGDATPAHDPVSVNPGSPASLRLETGLWNITAKAMAGALEKANGSASVNVPENGDIAVAITLNPVGGAPATGTLGYTLYFPAGTTGSLSLTDPDGSPVGSAVTTFVSGTEGSPISLDPGSYLVTVSLSSGGKTAGRTEAVHIVAGLTTKVAYNFYEDLAVAPTPVTSDADLAKIGVDIVWPLSGRYVLTGDITLNNWIPLGSMATPFTGSFDGGVHTITINSFDATALGADQYIGIFAAVQGIPENKAGVKNLAIDSSVSIAATSTTIGQGIGLVSGYAEDAVISGITLSGSLDIAGVTKMIFAGGIAGDMRKGAELRDCVSGMDLSVVSTATAALAGPPYTGAATAIGGLVGFFLTSADGAEYGGGKDVLIKNCVNSGDVTVNYPDVLSISGTITAGGIAGGWVTANANPYLGCIEDCAYTGNLNNSVTYNGGRSGGIMGGIAGNGGDAANEANTSRILRCRTEGSIEGGLYIGGIVGYATHGALIERCSSDVTIVASVSNAGGIAGALGRAPAQQVRISDCWSAGSVEGDSRIAGIGCIDLSGAAIIERCYSRAAVSLTPATVTGNQWLGGIYVGTTTTATVTKCVALNDGITATSADRLLVRRIWGGPANDNLPNATMNYAADIPITVLGGWLHTPTVARDGTLLEDDPPEQWLYEVTLGWDFDEVWVMGGDGYPKLRGVDN
jgi:hypothetical protein